MFAQCMYYDKNVSRTSANEWMLKAQIVGSGSANCIKWRRVRKSMNGDVGLLLSFFSSKAFDMEKPNFVNDLGNCRSRWQIYYLLNVKPLRISWAFHSCVNYISFQVYAHVKEYTSFIKFSAIVLCCLRSAINNSREIGWAIQVAWISFVLRANKIKKRLFFMSS